MFDYQFDERLKMSSGHAEAINVDEILRSQIPGALIVTKAHAVNDRSGTDYWVEHSSGRHISVDVKVREQDYAPLGKDDLAIETWSVVEAKKVGWTRDENKRTDYILWLWKDTKRWCLVPFHMLCRVTQDKWNEWSSQYDTATQRTVGNSVYHSECVFVPRKIVWREIYLRYSGHQCPQYDDGF